MKRWFAKWGRQKKELPRREFLDADGKLEVIDWQREEVVTESLDNYIESALEKTNKDLG